MREQSWRTFSASCYGPHIVQEAHMGSIPKVVGLMSCGFLLCFGLSHMAQAVHAAQANRPTSPADPTVRKGGHATVRAELLKSGHRIEGEVLRVEGKHYFVKGPDGQEVHLYTDQTTRKIGKISEGDRIVAVVNDQNHARSIRMADMSDRRNEKTDRTIDSTFESSKTGSMGP
jgi:hypothetical protein